jgi:hypothetical protein
MALPQKIDKELIERQIHDRAVRHDMFTVSAPNLSPFALSKMLRILLNAKKSG